jgi:hypothetical protein
VKKLQSDGKKLANIVSRFIFMSERRIRNRRRALQTIVVAVMPKTINMYSGRSYKPGVVAYYVVLYWYN